MAAETTHEQCHAITENGERCERPAGEDGFCYQHDETDETVDAYDESGDGETGAEGDGESQVTAADGGEAATEEAEEAEDDATGEAETEETGDDATGESEADDGSSEESDAAESGSTGSLEGVREVRETVQELAPEVIGRKLDAVIEVDGRDEGWRAVVEVVERASVPDTQDILGRYEIDLADGAVTGYRRVDRYRRSDTDAGEPR